MKKHLLLGLVTSLLTTWSGSALAITHRSLAAADPVARGVAVVRGGEVPDGCLATALSDRWVIVPREVYVDGRGRRCPGPDAARTTVTFGAGTFSVSALVERPGEPIRVDASASGGVPVTPVLVYLSAPLPAGSFPAVAPSVIPPTGGAMRGVTCVGRTPSGYGVAAMGIGWRNYSEGGATTYRTRNNQLITSALRGAVFAADADLGAPCFTGTALVGFTAALRNFRPGWTNEDLGTLVGLVEQRTWITEAMANPPVTFQVTGTWQGAHPHWSDAVIINADGTYHRGNGDPGRWTFDGRTLVLNWTNWGPEPVVLQPDGSFAAAGGGFTLRR